ncbi:nuclear transport factor 2 family protein [Amycolatopsis viridis]|uniref:Steroid delta-isomerase n=1 Tax=Amycolatopsis viridis TaxID=185678 RepID=A0ABX0SUZ0_9PSEU|nr:nuclear transport factor 2 family protein [Amycolatopsis viridis]NIH80792.1 steroid delta-isomerase [Amycolatopsis viridis]
MLTVDQLTDAVAEYVRRLEAGTASDIAALYADNATLEDPAGSEVRTGRAAITAFYRELDGLDVTAELLTVRASGDTAAFHMRVVTTAGGFITSIEPIDVMTFGADGLITSMRAIWSPGDIVHRRSTPA